MGIRRGASFALMFASGVLRSLARIVGGEDLEELPEPDDDGGEDEDLPPPAGDPTTHVGAVGYTEASARMIHGAQFAREAARRPDGDRSPSGPLPGSVAWRRQQRAGGAR